MALISSGGVHHKGQEPFHTRDDTSYREIPKGVVLEDLCISHFGYRTEDARKDPNCVFPIEPMRELEAEGTIGRLADPAYSFMGGIYSTRRVWEEVAPRFVETLKDNNVDLFYLVPA